MNLLLLLIISVVDTTVDTPLLQTEPSKKSKPKRMSGPAKAGFVAAATLLTGAALSTRTHDSLHNSPPDPNEKRDFQHTNLESHLASTSQILEHNPWEAVEFLGKRKNTIATKPHAIQGTNSQPKKKKDNLKRNNVLLNYQENLNIKLEEVGLLVHSFTLLEGDSFAGLDKKDGFFVMKSMSYTKGRGMRSYVPNFGNFGYETQQGLGRKNDKQLQNIAIAIYPDDPDVEIFEFGNHDIGGPSMVNTMVSERPSLDENCIKLRNHITLVEEIDFGALHFNAKYAEACKLVVDEKLVWKDVKRMPVDPNSYSNRAEFDDYLRKKKPDKFDETAIEIVNYWPEKGIPYENKFDRKFHTESFWNEVIATFPVKSIKAVLYDGTVDNARAVPLQLLKHLNLPEDMLIPFGHNVNFKKPLKKRFF